MTAALNRLPREPRAAAAADQRKSTSELRKEVLWQFHEKILQVAEKSVTSESTRAPVPVPSYATFTVEPVRSATIGDGSAVAAVAEKAKEVARLDTLEMPIIGKAFVSNTEWEGYIAEIGDHDAIAVMKDVSDQFSAEKIVTVPLKKIPEPERKFAQLGAIFRLLIGSELRYRESKKHPGKISLTTENVAKLYFRRAIYKSPAELSRMKAAIDNLASPE